MRGIYVFIKGDTMTLLQKLAMGALLVSSLAQAQYGVYQPGRPERPSRPGYPGQYQQSQVSRHAWIGRSVRNERLPLRQLADIGRELVGYNVDSVQVHLRPARNTNARLELELNRRVEDSRSVYNETFIELRPRGWDSQINQNDSVQLHVSGEVYIDRVIVNLSNRGHGGGGYYPPVPPPNYGETVVQLQLPPIWSPMARIDLTPYIDIHRLRGMSLVGVEVTASARYNAAALEVVINSFRQGTISLNSYQTTQVVRPRQVFVIGQSLGNLMLEPRGDTALQSVRLLLRR
jgi:hypothetical protein